MEDIWFLYIWLGGALLTFLGITLWKLFTAKSRADFIRCYVDVNYSEVFLDISLAGLLSIFWPATLLLLIWGGLIIGAWKLLIGVVFNLRGIPKENLQERVEQTKKK